MGPLQQMFPQRLCREMRMASHFLHGTQVNNRACFQLLDRGT